LDDFAKNYRHHLAFVSESKDTMPITVGNIVDALEALGGEAHYSDITAQVLKVARPLSLQTRQQV
jgi:hypothetical protein